MIDRPTTAPSDGAGQAELSVLDGWTAGAGRGWAPRCRIGATVALGVAGHDVEAIAWDEAQRAMLELAGGRRGRLEALTECSRCGTAIDIDLRLADVLGGDQVEHRGGEVRPAPRVPTVGDVLDAASVATAAAAEALLAERCVGDRPACERDAALRELDELHPLLAPACAVTCPECGERFDATLDSAELCWAAIEATAALAIDDVVALASAFGWSEADVLAIPPHRRAVYRRLGEGAAR